MTSRTTSSRRSGGRPERRSRDAHRGHHVAVGVADRRGHGGQPDLELVDGEGVALLADPVELVAQRGPAGDRRGCTSSACRAPRRADASSSPLSSTLPLLVACSGMCWPTQLCGWRAEDPATWSRYSAELSDRTAMLTVSPVSAASWRQTGAPRDQVEPGGGGAGQPQDADAEAVAAAVAVCSTRRCASRVATSRNAVLLWTPSSRGDLGDAGLAVAGQHLEDGRAPGRPTARPGR